MLFRETCQWLKFTLNGLRAQSRVSPMVGLLPLASGSACLCENVYIFVKCPISIDISSEMNQSISVEENFSLAVHGQ